MLLHLCDCLADQKAIDQPDKLELTGVKGTLFPWSYWRYYSFAHVIAGFLFTLFLRAHGPLSVYRHRTTPIPIPTT